ncbi:hypothetical protein [Streptomyces sp. GC420]|uniref:hypothetical protein n=1 Tax=Streptomyces sp. GC420 TaxID=2697568 RepID=UPI001414D24E|nr:hypothetical protein [Streptomyces sp. GC420]NBM18822.1 hypothetical protein [Streptomyces sp. GC420]
MSLLIAVAAPAVRIRRAALAVQVLAECTALLVILSPRLRSGQGRWQCGQPFARRAGGARGA